MKKRKLWVITAILIPGFWLLTSDLYAQVPGIINYQGRVVVNGTNFTGNGQFKFALVDGVGATTYWSNDGTAVGEPAAAVSITVNKGLYSVLLGQTPMVSISPTVFTNTDVRLRVWFASGSGMQPLTPDQRIGAVGYAMIAASVPGSGIIGAISNAQVTGSVRVDSTELNNGGLYPGLLFGDPATGEGISSKRTPGGNQWGLDFYTWSLPRLTIAGNGNVGIGATNPLANLTVQNPGSADPIGALDIDVASFATSSNAAASHYLRMRDLGAGTAFIFTGDGRLGIGTGSPQENLDVAGRIVVADSANASPRAGTIRWTGTDFQGFNGQQWQSLTMPAPADMVRVPAGTFTMGSIAATNSGLTDTIPLHQVTLSAFYLAKYETTYGLWYAVRQWALTNGYNFRNPGNEGSQIYAPGAAPTENAALPVVRISWRDCIVWCNAYSEMQNLTPVYTYTNAVIRDSRDSNATACDNAVFNQDRNGYRLPTEAEWEYAARYIDGRIQTPGNYASGAGGPYTDTNANMEVSWCHENSWTGTRPVGTKRSNQLGICDMSGNVAEWCWDWYADYSSSAVTNPAGPPTGSYRVFRIACWNVDKIGLQTAMRACYPTSHYETESGFRLARNAQ